MLLINCETNLLLTWFSNCFIVAGTIDGQETIFAITDTKLCFPVVTLSTQDNAKLLRQLKLGLKRTTNWNKYQSKTSIET